LALPLDERDVAEEEARARLCGFLAFGVVLLRRTTPSSELASSSSSPSSSSSSSSSSLALFAEAGNREGFAPVLVVAVDAGVTATAVVLAGPDGAPRAVVAPCTASLLAVVAAAVPTAVVILPPVAFVVPRP
jgi:hypothetical protein